MTSLLFLAVPVTTSALSAAPGALPEASNATDYQPPTDNPQNNVGSVSQSQGQNGQSNLQPQQKVDQTALPNVPDLRVPGVIGQPNSNTTKTEITKDQKQTMSTWLIILLGGLAVFGVVYLLASSTTKRANKQPTKDEKVTKPSKSEVVKKNEEKEKTESVKPSTTSKKTTKRKKGKNGKKAKRKR